MNRSHLAAVAAAVLLAAGVPLTAVAEEHIELTMVVEKEITVEEENGERQVQRIRPELVVPGEEVIYTILYSNVLDDPATNTVITNPVPQHMTYTPGSARGDNTDILFSVNGTHFSAAESLIVRTADGTERPATAQDYTHVRWLLKAALLPGQEGQVSYRARLQ